MLELLRGSPEASIGKPGGRVHAVLQPRTVFATEHLDHELGEFDSTAGEVTGSLC